MTRSLLLAFLAGTAARGGAWGAAAPVHPLDPLGAEEIAHAVEVLRHAGHVDGTTLYPELDLAEPEKALVLGWAPGDPVARRARVVALQRARNLTFEGVVDLAASRVVAWQPVTAGQPMILLGEYDQAGAVVRADPRWRDAMARRGIDDPEAVYLDVWAPGEVKLDTRPVPRPAPRLARALSFHRETQKNPYGPPVEGVVAMVNLNTMQVIEVRDTGVRPMSKESTDYYDPAVTGTRAALAPLVVATPEGPGFAVEGHEIRWDHWRLRWSVRPREGLVIHQARWMEGDRERLVLYRASLSEMVVPYADPSEGWAWRSAFDEGEYGLGRLGTPLVRGLTAPTHATLLPATFAGDDGVPAVVEGAAAVYERDAGLLWFHYDMVHGSAARRARELVIEAITTIGNYDYGTRWVLRQDGQIDFELILSGSLLTKGVAGTRCETCSFARGEESKEPVGEQRNGTLVAENVLAPHHQHFVNLRLDLDVDGTANAVKEVNLRPDRGSKNPRANAFRAVSTLLPSERKARRHVSPAEGRTWEVFNPSRRNAQGHPAAYALVPGSAGRPYLGPRSPLRHRAAFAASAFHATRFHDEETFAAGRYPNQNAAAEGLVRWIQDDESLEGDVVAWYTIGVTHVARPEEYPIMNATRAGFHLVPVGFFSKNPGLDVPAAPRE